MIVGFEHAQNMEDERSPERESSLNRHGPSDDTLDEWPCVRVTRSHPHG